MREPQYWERLTSTVITDSVPLNSRGSVPVVFELVGKVDLGKKNKEKFEVKGQVTVASAPRSSNSRWG